MGNRRMGPPTEVVLALKSQLRLEDFVESGTFLGDTTAWASEHFHRVITIELSTKYHAGAVERFRARPGVTVLNGNSAARLREIVPGLAKPAVFWLDAHWSGLDTAGREAECPVIEEIAAINAAAPAHIVMVDDARLFGAPPPRPHRAEEWPDLATTMTALGNGDRRYVALFDDVLIAVPSSAREFLRGVLQDLATATRDSEHRQARWRRLFA